MDETHAVTMQQVYAFLEHWSLAQAHPSFVAQRENTVYRVDTISNKSYALRIRRVGYRSDLEINSELEWMAMLAKEGLRVPVPVAASDGTHIVRIGKYRAPHSEHWVEPLQNFTCYQTSGHYPLDLNVHVGTMMRY